MINAFNQHDQSSSNTARELASPRPQEEVMVSISLLRQVFQSPVSELNSTYSSWTPVIASRRVSLRRQTSSCRTSETRRNNKVQQTKLYLRVRVLFQYLEMVDPEMLYMANEVLKDCEYKHKIKDSKYDSLADAINYRLRSAVGEAHWKKARKIQKQLMINHRRRKTLEFGLVGLGQHCTL